MKYIGLTTLFLSSLTQAATYTVTTNIAKIRTVPEFNSVTQAHQHVPFKVEEALQGGCTWLYLTPESKSSYSMLLAAKLADKPLSIKYSDSGAPWSAATCQVHHIDLD